MKDPPDTSEIMLLNSPVTFCVGNKKEGDRSVVKKMTGGSYVSPQTDM